MDEVVGDIIYRVLVAGEEGASSYGRGPVGRRTSDCRLRLWPFA